MRVSRRSQRSDEGADPGAGDVRGDRLRGLFAGLRGRGLATLARLLPAAAAALLSLVATVVAVAADLLAGLLRALAAAVTTVATPLMAMAERLAAWVANAVRLLTPARVLLAAAIGCAVLLAVSQFADYRGIAVGSPDYSGVEAVAPAPQLERAETGSAHAYVMLPLAVLAVLALLVAVRSGRWRLARIAVLVGIAAIVVSLAVDRPAGLDEGSLAREFAGAEARLLGGFWVQLAAGAGLAATSLLLGIELRRRRPARSRRRLRAVDPDPVAGPPPEGASA